jgi:hypothetical protein
MVYLWGLKRRVLFRRHLRITKINTEAATCFEVFHAFMGKCVFKRTRQVFYTFAHGGAFNRDREAPGGGQGA